MSEMSVSALSNAQYDGSVQVADTGLRGMITLRGDLADKGLAKAVKAATGLGVPKQRQVLTKGSNGVAWMSPDELLIMVPYSAATQTAADLPEKPYGQHALVANVSFSKSHGNCAYERFTDEGPLALLPLLAGPAGEERSALVWTLPPQRAETLQAAGDEEFTAALQDRFGYRLGRIEQVGERSIYPLSLVQSTEQVRRNVVVMGNAAHALHPVAGQGFNLALRDVVELSRVLAAAVADKQSPGDLSVLEQYQLRQRADQEKTITFSDQVPALFMHADPAIGLGRDLALAGMDVLPVLKREFVRHAAGMAGVTSSVSSSRG